MSKPDNITVSQVSYSKNELTLKLTQFKIENLQQTIDLQQKIRHIRNIFNQR